MTDLKQKSAQFIALAGAATPGPYRKEYSRGMGGPNTHVWAGDDLLMVAYEVDDDTLDAMLCMPDMAQHIAALQAENDALREALERLEQYAEDSDGACYGTLSTKLLRDIASAALTKHRGQS